MNMKLKRNVKDSVFTDLFSDKKYVLELYKSLFVDEQDNEDISEEDINIITLENVLTNAMYNDLGFLVKNRLIVLAEAQSTWSDNIAVRMLLYVANTYKEFIDKNEIDLYTSAKASLPRPELFVIYTGEKHIQDTSVSLADKFFDGKGSVDINIKIITEGRDDDIVCQYVKFTKVINEQIKKYGYTEQAISETIRICTDEEVLKEYLSNRKEEVVDMMCALFDEEKIMKAHDKTVHDEGMAKGMVKGMAKGRAEGRIDMLEALRKLGVDETILQAAASEVK